MYSPTDSEKRHEKETDAFEHWIDNQAKNWIESNLKSVVQMLIDNDPDLCAGVYAP